MLPPRRILVAYQSLAGVGPFIAGRRPDLEVRARKAGEIGDDDLDWAEAFVGFRRPAVAGWGGVRWVHCVGAGVDAFLLHDPLPDDLLLTRTSEPFGPQIAEYCLSRALVLTQGVLELAESQRAHRWSPRHPQQLRGSRVVVVGTGEVGSSVAHAFAAAGCEVHGVSRGGTPKPPFRSVAPTSALGSMVGDAQWIVLALPLTRETLHIVDRAVLSRCKGAVLINVGRGALVDEEALPQALDQGWLRSAVLDVFTTEPLPAASPLWARSDVLISPHVAGLTTVEGAGEGFLECLSELEGGRLPRMTVDRGRGY